MTLDCYASLLAGIVHWRRSIRQHNYLVYDCYVATVEYKVTGLFLTFCMLIEYCWFEETHFVLFLKPSLVTQVL